MKNKTKHINTKCVYAYKYKMPRAAAAANNPTPRIAANTKYIFGWSLSQSRVFAFLSLFFCRSSMLYS